ncbi:MAG: 2-oxoacid:acceptor oxidoreductase subunit alpha [Planctomycetota bacterium]|nr:2-oxoacid:acceptor oxidoreductase subunit alpha [Planctomycetota bacterium]
MTATTTPTETPTEGAIPLDSVAIRFCGDSGDGMQLTGGEFTNTTAVVGNDFATFPDFPAEIRAPRGTTFGVSGFQIHFASHSIYTPGDAINALVSMNPAAFKMNIGDVEPGGIVIANEDEFTKVNLKKAGYTEESNPLDDAEIQRRFQLYRVPISRLTRESLAETGMGAKDVDRCRNMYALGMVYWLYQRPLDGTIKHLENYFGKSKGKPEVADINIRALKAGYHFGETAEMFPSRFVVGPADMEAGLYRKISGNEALVLGLAAVASKSSTGVLYAGYPITPASDLLHGLSRLKQFNIQTFQAEDEIAAVCAAIGGSFAGQIGVCGTSGPGLALKAEGIGLATMLELPLLVIDVQRAGPSTGMPTKTEQADLFQALYGRSGEAPVIVLAAASPSDCFRTIIEAAHLAVRHMCPVIVLTDGAIANGAEPWRVPDLDAIEPIVIQHPTQPNTESGYQPYVRDDKTHARPWAIPGTPGLEHRLGGLEKEANTGNVSYDGDNHDAMCRIRQAKVAAAADVIPPLEVQGDSGSSTLVLGWGSTSGAIAAASMILAEEGCPIAYAHLRHLNPFPSNLESLLQTYERVIVPEVNLGQLCTLIRGTFMKDAVSISEMKGRSFKTNELVDRIKAVMQGSKTGGAS